jgi:diguanylate cyclase (GGDEF)-like protein/PAS domain S-box-containing protein
MNGGDGDSCDENEQPAAPVWDVGQRAFCTAMDAIVDGIFLIDRTSMRIVHVNDAACRLQNQSRAEILAQLPWDILAIPRAELERAYDALIAGEADAACVELLLQGKNSSPIWVELRRHAQRAGEGWMIISQVRDITPRKQAEAILLASETRFRNVFEKAYTGMAIADLDGTLLEANNSLAQLLGYSRRELIGMNIANFTHPDDLGVERVFLNEIQTGHRDDYRMNKRYLTRSGEELWVDLLVTAIPDEQGAGVNAIGLMVDITERRRAEAELRIAAVAFQSHEAMMVTDRDGVILRVNQAFTEITGYRSEEAVGQTPLLLQSGRHNADFYREMWDVIDRTGGWRGEVWDRRKNGEVYPKWLTVSAVKGDDGIVTHYIGAHTDISERKKADEKINELAFFDQLTGLPNRTLMLDRLKQALAASSRDGSYGALLFIDLDDFKTLNDTLGHEVGDQLLKQVAQRLTLCMREGDTVARLGGDEFVAILKGLGAGKKEAANGTLAAAQKILAVLAKADQLDSTAHYNTASIGATLFHGSQVAIDELMKQADLSMYKSKAAGRNTVHFFDPAMEVELKARSSLEADLRLALKEQQFLLHYQAQVVDDGRLTGAEVLVRWQHPQRGMVSPADFIPLAEDTRLILPLGHWVLKTACAQLSVWATQPDMAQLNLAVNISAHQFGQHDFVDEVLAILNVTGANPRRLKLELTESLLVHNVQDIIEKMFALKAKGVGFSLDDFGTGYSSLAYLKRLPLDQLKIDQSFVRDVLIDPNDAAIAKTVVALAQTLGLGVIAEGVETAAQRDFLASSGCHAYQGYFFCRPLPIEDFVAFARRS